MLGLVVPFCLISPVKKPISLDAEIQQISLLQLKCPSCYVTVNKYSQWYQNKNANREQCLNCVRLKQTITIEHWKKVIRREKKNRSTYILNVERVTLLALFENVQWKIVHFNLYHAIYIALGKLYKFMSKRYLAKSNEFEPISFLWFAWSSTQIVEIWNNLIPECTRFPSLGYQKNIISSLYSVGWINIRSSWIWKIW